MNTGPEERRMYQIVRHLDGLMDDLYQKARVSIGYRNTCQEIYDTFRDIADGKTGLEGAANDALTANLQYTARLFIENSVVIESLANRMGEAQDELKTLAKEYKNLPDASYAEAERLAHIATGIALSEVTAISEGFSDFIEGITIDAIIEKQQIRLREIREEAAKNCMFVFEDKLAGIESDLRDIREQIVVPVFGDGVHKLIPPPAFPVPPLPPEIDKIKTVPRDLVPHGLIPPPTEIVVPGVNDPRPPPAVYEVTDVPVDPRPGANKANPADNMDWALPPEEYQRRRAAADGSVGGVIDYGQPGGPGGAGSAGGGAGTGGLSGNAGLGVAGIGAAGAVGAGAASVAGLGRGGQGGPGVIGPGGPGGTGGGGSGTGSGSSSGAGASSRSGGLSGAGGPGDVSSGQGGVRGVDGRIIHGGQGGQAGMGGMSESERRARRLARHGVFAEREEEDEARRKKKEEEARAARKPVDPDAWCIVPSLADLEESARQEAKYQREKATTADGWIRPCDLLIRLADRINTQTQLAAEATNTAELARFAAETAQADQDTDPESLTKLVEKARTTASASLAANQALDATYADLDRARAADEKFRTDNIRFRETVHKKQYKYWLKDQAEKARINALFRNRLRRLLHIDPPLVQEQFIPREIPDYLIK